MKKILIPVDFSDCSLANARYTIRMFAANPGVSMVLYNMYEKPSEEAGAYLSFESITYGLTSEVASRVSSHAELGNNYPVALSRYARHIMADMIITCLSDSTIRLIEKNACPVLMIPSDAEYREIHKVALISDFYNVDLTTPTGPICRVLDLFKPELFIVNVNSEFYISLDEHYQEQKEKMEELFKEYDPQFDFISRYDFRESINQYVDDHQIDMVITIPRFHTFIENLFRTHHTRELASSSHVPVLAVHE
jgi:nucleotide-binding universal stress UspA family protein